MELHEDVESLDTEQLRALCTKLNPDTVDTDDLDALIEERQTFLGETMRLIRDIAMEEGKQELPFQNKEYLGGETYDAWTAHRWTAEDVHGLDMTYAAQVDSRYARDAFIRVDGGTKIHLYANQMAYRDPFDHTVDSDAVKLQTYNDGDWTETIDYLLEHTEQALDGYEAER